MKKSLFITLILITTTASAQKGIKALINTERSFASFTVANGIKSGFLQFLDSTGVIFPSASAQNGIAFYSKGPEVPVILNWAPEYAVISASGDFGFTTGPYHLMRSINDTISGRGQYSSVWHITEKGEWKFLADMGTRYTNQRDLPLTVAELDLGNINTETFSMDDVIVIDKKLNQQLREKGAIAFNEYLTTQSWFNINGKAPTLGSKAISANMLGLPSNLSFEYNNGKIASSKDMAFTYGTLSNNNKKDPYMRVWTKQKTGWVLLLQVISW